MFGKKNNRIALFLAGLLFTVLFLSGGIQARRALASEGSGSIHYTLSYGGEAVPGVEISLYKVGRNDPEIGIVWPEVVGAYHGTASAEGYSLSDGTPLNLSEKDQKWKCLME